MDMRRLEVFCKVVELRSFTKAAESLSLSQPTISEHIRILEETVRERLIDRLGREVLPTPAGKLLYQYVRNIVQLRDEAIHALGQFKGNLAGALVLGASTIPGTYVLPKFIGTFKAKHPAIQITLRIADTAETVHSIIEGAVEAGVIGSKWSDRRLSTEEIFSDELVLTVFPGHPWARRGTIDPEELIREPFILREQGSGTRTFMKQTLEESGFDVSHLSVVAEMGSTEAVRQGIKSEVGVSILSYQAVEEDIQHGHLAKVEIRGIRFVRPLYLAQRKNRQISPLCAVFLDHLRGTVRSSRERGTAP